MEVLIKNNGFHISNCPNNYVNVEFKQNRMKYMEHEGIIVIPFTDIYELTSGKASILKIIDDEGNELIDLSELVLQENETLYDSFKDTVISLYPSKQKYMRILVGELPISHRFIRSNPQIYSVNQIDEGIVEVAVELRTLVSPVISGDLFFTFRGTINRWCIASNRAEFILKEDLEYVSRLYFHITPEISIHFKEFEGYSNYFNNIIDLSVMFQTQINYLFARRHRVGNENSQEFYFLQEYKENLTGMKFYQTLNKMSSIIVESIPYESREGFNLEAKTHKSEKLTALFCEYPEKAQDTAFNQFKFMVDNHSDQFDCFYIIDKHSPDLVNLTDYPDNVVYYKSMKHFEKFMEADMIFHSHSSMYAEPTKMLTFQNKLDNTFKVFLQHGILGVRDLSFMYAKKEKEFTNLFICSSDREKKIIKNDYFYSEDEIALTGLSRFDELFAKYEVWKSIPKDYKQLLIFPSWRKGQNRLSDEKFMETEFYQEFQSLLNDEEFIELLKRYNIKAKFLLHPNFNQYRYLFTSEYIDTSYDNYILQNELVENDYLLTDYSSAALDFALLRKSIVYYQFDTKLVEAKKDAKLGRFLPGDIVRNRKRMIKKLDKAFQREHMLKKHERKLKKLYKYQDTNARKRILDASLKLYHQLNK